MGGMLNLAVRDGDGIVHKFRTYTGVGNDLFYNKKFNEGNFQEATKEFFKKLEQYADGDEFKIDSLSPYWYGLLVVDLKDKVIHNMQGYDDPGDISITTYSPNRIIQKEESQKMDELIKLNYIDIYYRYNLMGSIHEVFGNDVDLKKVSAFAWSSLMSEDIVLKGERVKLENSLLLSIKPKAFKDFSMIDYDHDKNGAEKFQKALVNSGFVLSDEDKKAWDEWIKERE